MLSPVRLADPAPPRLSPFPLLLYATTGTTTRQAFYLGLGHGMAAYGATLHWLTHIFGKAAIPLFAIMALFTAGFCGLNNGLEKRARSTTAKILIAAGLWTAFEFYRSELFFLRFPWITPGTGLGPTFLSPLVGVYGASFLVVAAGAAALYRKSLPAAVLLNAGVAGLLLARPPAVAPPRNRGFTVAVVQDEDCNLDTHIALSQSLRKVKPALDRVARVRCALRPEETQIRPGSAPAILRRNAGGAGAGRQDRNRAGTERLVQHGAGARWARPHRRIPQGATGALFQ